MEDLKSSDRTIGSCKRTLPNNAYIVHVDLRYTSGVRVIDPGKVNSPLEPKVNSLSHPAILILTPNTKTPSIKKRGSSFSLSLPLALSTHQRSPHTRTPPQIQNEPLWSKTTDTTATEDGTKQTKINSLFSSSSSSSSYSSTASAPDDLKPWASATIDLKTPQSRATKSSVREYGEYATPVAAFVSKP